MTENKNIHEAIISIMKDVGYVQKKRTGGLNYTYAGEAALISALRPAMVENEVFMSVLSIANERGSYQTSKGTNMNTTVVNGTVQFHHAPSETSILVSAIGEGADVGDKSANKAMTGMYKYALRQTFMIETGDDPDNFKSEPAAKIRNWSEMQKQYLINKSYSENVFSAKAMLNKSTLPGNAPQAHIESWGKYYRASRDEDNTSDLAAEAANKKYAAAMNKDGK